MANLGYTVARRTDNLHTVTRSSPAAVASAGTAIRRLDLTVVTNPADGDTIEIADGTATIVFEFDLPNGVGGGNTAVNLGGTAALTATELATVIDASALAAAVTVSNPSAGVVRLEWSTALTITFRSSSVKVKAGASSPSVTLTSITVGPVALLIDNTASKNAVRDALEAIERALSRDFGGADAPADIATSGTSLE